MNYWPAEVCGLGDCHGPLFDALEELAEAGEKTARINFGCRGFTVNHNVDIWRQTTPVSGIARHAVWPMAGGWLCRHLWEHYLFTGDMAFLRERAYPVMKKAALFFCDWLYEDGEGHLVTCPSTTPENEFLTADGPVGVSIATTMDMSIIRELFGYTAQAADTLGIDAPFAGELRQKEARLLPYQIGRYGQIMEWYKDFDELWPGHRHLSPLYGLYPGDRITPTQTPELAAACRATLERRAANDVERTGWTAAWLTCLYARLGDGDRAGEFVDVLLRESLSANLFDIYPPFQIDANLGIVAGMAEMLLQSHEGHIELLPALPAAWPEGCVTGLCARGGYRVDIRWSGGKLTACRVQGVGVPDVRYRGVRVPLDGTGQYNAGSEQI